MSNLAILWHLHQPEYRDPHTGRFAMPWTRLHAIRGYRDIAVETLEHGAPVTVNLVPSLLDQVLEYADGATDRHLELTRRPAADLTGEEADEIRGTFVCGNPAMIQAHAPYRRLRERVEADALHDAAGLRDLQVWSTLAWFGATALRDHPSLQALRDKGHDFTEDDKAEMLAVQQQIVADLPARFAALATGGRAAVSTSPYYHPILPLLVDASHARRCMPGLPDEVRFAWPQDARVQLERARERMTALLGVAPRGLWPSEGSVSPEVVALAREAGFSWFASDEGVLHRSRRDRAPNNGGWDVDGVVGFFRDRDLSDRIGFQYARKDGREAAAELVAEVERRAQGGTVVLALDGENPWEAFADAGAAFRSALHRELTEGRVRGVTLDEAAERPVVGRVEQLHTGSWIRADFHIWIGHADDRRAWNLLARTREAVEAATEGREQAMEHVYAAEGSDWTWWYGDDFSTPFAHVFDALFRARLRAAWEAIGRTPPPELGEPIQLGAQPRCVRPTHPIGPSLERVRWLDWAGAGCIVSGPGGAMSRGVRHVERVRYGWSEPDDDHPDGALWLRVDLPDALPPADPGARWEIAVGRLCVTLPYAAPDARHAADGAEAARVGPGLVARFDAARLDADAVPVAVRVVAGGEERARFPEAGEVLIERPRIGAWFV